MSEIEIDDLVKLFTEQRQRFKSINFNEAQTRVQLINPLFAALGWDMDNTLRRLPEDEKEVVHEARVRLRSGPEAGRLKAPDYAFRVGRHRKFFVEAKSPSVSISGNLASAFQVRRYAWSDPSVKLAILTDFEEFAVYDGRVRPKRGDSPRTARLFYCTYEEYAEHWGWISSVFSRDAVFSGAFDRFVEEDAETGLPRESPGDAFLSELEVWRERIARNVAKNHPDINVRSLNSAVQRTIDRIVFLRIAEDRGIEPAGELAAIASGRRVYPRLIEVFREADARYNSGLFHFAKERNRPGEVDTLTPSLQIDDRVLKPIIESLYPPQSSYAFDALPADLLGQVYERFLGKVIRLEGGEAQIDEKPEVKKAGGVYYTPTFVVDYIVHQALGKRLEGLTLKKAASVRLIDPACGSGSFLIGAYDYLLRWYLRQYTSSDPEGHARGRPPRLVRGQSGDWRLSLEEKKRILLTHIFGVDIDAQAVEVTKLSLLLRVLEGETAETLGLMQGGRGQSAARKVARGGSLFQERVLPELAANIQFGNSLIESDFYDGKPYDLFTPEEHFIYNAFDWEDGFPEAMEDGGFDIVIGNPPYLNVDNVWGKGDPRLAYLKSHYAEVYNDKTDILFYFFKRALDLSKGTVGFIVSRAFQEAFKADKLRGYLSREGDVRQILDFQNYPVFKGVGITTSIVILDKEPRGSEDATVYRLDGADSFSPDSIARLDQDALDPRPDLPDPSSLFTTIRAAQETFGPGAWNFAETDAQSVIEKIDVGKSLLGDILPIGQGMQTGRNNVFGKLTEAQVKAWGVSEDAYFIRARNSDIQPFKIRDSGQAILYLEDFEAFEDLPDGVQTYLLEHEAILKKRAAYQRGNCDWWRYTWPLHKEHMDRTRILCPYLAKENRFALDDQGRYLGLTDTTVLFDSDQPEDLRYFLGLLNSHVLTFRMRYIAKLKSSGIYEYFENSVSKLPIRRIDFSDSDDVAAHDEMVRLVEEVIGLQTRAFQTSDAETTQARRRERTLTRKIEELSLRLYGLSDQDKGLVDSVASQD